MNSLLNAQYTEKANIGYKLTELLNSSRAAIESKMKIVNNLLLSIKEENELVISKGIYIFF